MRASSPGFNLGRTFLKSSGLFVAIVAGGDAASNWSAWLKAFENQVSAEGATLFYVYGVWVGLFILYDLARWKLRRDLDAVRAENRRKKPRRRK